MESLTVFTPFTTTLITGPTCCTPTDSLLVEILWTPVSGYPGQPSGDMMKIMWRRIDWRCSQNWPCFYPFHGRSNDAYDIFLVSCSNGTPGFPYVWSRFSWPSSSSWCRWGRMPILVFASQHYSRPSIIRVPTLFMSPKTKGDVLRRLCDFPALWCTSPHGCHCATSLSLLLTAGAGGRIVAVEWCWGDGWRHRRWRLS